MRKWIVAAILLLFLTVCGILTLPGSSSDMLGTYIHSVTAASWTALALILLFLFYIFRTEGKR